MIHWDSKILSALAGKNNVNRLPIIATAMNVEQLLEVPQMPSGTGYEISFDIFDTFQRWLLLDKVQAFVFNTTASNTGRFSGAAYF